MYNHFSPKSAKFLVAVQFDQTLPHVLSFSKDLAQRFGAKLRLTHVDDTFLAYSWTQSYPTGYIAPEMVQDLARDRQKQLELNLKKAATENFADFEPKPEVSCPTGLVADTLDADARVSKSSLIIVGIKDKSYRMVPKGFSTALSLMARSYAPVMVVPENVSHLTKASKLKIMVCDDLTSHSAPAISLALDMGAGAKQSDIYHVHIYPKDKSEMERFTQDVQKMMNLDKIPLDPEFTSANLMLKTKTTIEKDLESRLGDAKLLIEENGGRYYPKVFFGDVLEQLKTAIAEVKPDLIVFGRHKTIRMKPMGIGRLPFYAMIGLGVPVMIAAGE